MRIFMKGNITYIFRFATWNLFLYATLTVKSTEWNPEKTDFENQDFTLGNAQRKSRSYVNSRLNRYHPYSFYRDNQGDSTLFKESEVEHPSSSYELTIDDILEEEGDEESDASQQIIRQESTNFPMLEKHTELEFILNNTFELSQEKEPLVFLEEQSEYTKLQDEKDWLEFIANEILDTKQISLLPEYSKDDVNEDHYKEETSTIVDAIEEYITDDQATLVQSENEESYINPLQNYVWNFGLYLEKLFNGNNTDEEKDESSNDSEDTGYDNTDRSKECINEECSMTLVQNISNSDSMENPNVSSTIKTSSTLKNKGNIMNPLQAYLSNFNLYLERLSNENNEVEKDQSSNGNEGTEHDNIDLSRNCKAGECNVTPVQKMSDIDTVESPTILGMMEDEDHDMGSLNEELVCSGFHVSKVPQNIETRIDDDFDSDGYGKDNPAQININNDIMMQDIIEELIGNENLKNKEKCCEPLEKWSIGSFDISFLESEKESEEESKEGEEEDVEEEVIEIEEIPIDSSGLHVEETSNIVITTDTDVKEDDDEHDEMKFFFFNYLQKGTSFLEVTYLSKFRKVAPHLSDINICISENNPDKIAKTEDWLTVGSRKNVHELSDMNFPITFSNRHSFLVHLMNIYNHIEHFNKFVYSDEEQNNNALCFLDTSVCAKIYLQLLMNFPQATASCTNRDLRNFFEEDTIISKCFSEHDVITTRSIPELVDIFSELTVPVYKRNCISKLQHFYELFFNIYVGNRERNIVEEPFTSHILNLRENICKIKKEVATFFSSISDCREEDICAFIEECIQNNKIKFIKETENLISRIMKEKEELKNLIKKSIGKPEIEASYIFYHLSFLLLQRLCNVRKEKFDYQNCLAVYKSFVKAFFNTSSKTMNLKNFEEMTTSEKNILFENECALHYIISYVNLNIVYILLNESNEKQCKSIKILKTCHEYWIYFKETEDYVEAMNLLSNSYDLMKEIENMLNTFCKHKDMVELLLGKFILAEKILAIINSFSRTFDYFTSQKYDYVSDIFHKTIIKKYREIKLLRKNLRQNVKEKS